MSSRSLKTGRPLSLIAIRVLGKVNFIIFNRPTRLQGCTIDPIDQLGFFTHPLTRLDSSVTRLTRSIQSIDFEV